LWSDFYIRLRSLIRRATVDEELDEELRFHLEQQAKKYVEAGIVPEQAKRRARLLFGGLTQVEQQCRQARGITFVETAAQDVRFGLRSLSKSPLFTAVVVVTLALGIGANTAIFGLVNAVMLQSIPVKDPAQLVIAEWSAHAKPQRLGSSSFGDCGRQEGNKPDPNSGCTWSYPMFREIGEHKDLFVNTAAFAGTGQIDLSGNGRATIAQGELVSGSFFETLGVTAALGRTLDPLDEKPDAAPVAVLDYAYWQEAFGGSPAAIGRSMRLNNTPFTIVGVAAPGFTRLTPGKSVDLWVPLSQGKRLGLPWAQSADENNWWLVIVGRLQADVSLARAESAIDSLFVNEMLHGQKPVWASKDDPHLHLLSAQEGLTGIRYSYGQPLLLLMAAVALVLLVACANVAGLMLARGASRQGEMAVRLAVGAGRRRVIQQLLTESLLLSSAGAALGVLLAYPASSGLAGFFSANSYSPLRLDLHPNPTVLLFAVSAAVLTGIGFGLAPALVGARADVATGLKENTAKASAAQGKGRFPSLGNGLVIVQVALSMVVLTGAGLLLRTLENLHSIDPGFDTHNILLFSLDPQLAGYKDQQVSDLYKNLQRRLNALPGVESSSYSSSALLDGGLWSEDIRVEGQSDKNTVEAQMLAVGADYQKTMRIPLLEGRLLQPEDVGAPRRAALVNQAFVRLFLSGRNPLGVHFGGTDPKDPQWEIVGVIGDTKYPDLRSEDQPTAFVPLTTGGATFALRTAVAPSGLMQAARSVVNTVDPNLPVIRMRTQSDAIDRLLFNERLVARLFGLFGGLGLILTSIGLYGLLSYEVVRRTREIGIRTALGAQRRDVLLLVLRQGLALVTAGALAGIVVALGVTRLLTSLLYDVRPADPSTLALVAGLLIVVGAMACALPAGRAASIDPITALRCE
jgi:predicted permease